MCEWTLGDGTSVREERIDTGMDRMNEWIQY